MLSAFIINSIRNVVEPQNLIDDKIQLNAKMKTFSLGHVIWSYLAMITCMKYKTNIKFHIHIF